MLNNITGQKRVIPEEGSSSLMSCNCFGSLFHSRVAPLTTDAQLPVIETVNREFNLTIQKISTERFGHVYVDNSSPDTENFGSKHANLKRVDRMVKAAGLAGVEVPTPYGLSSESVENFLKEQKLEIIPLWNKLASLFKGDLSQPDVSSLLSAIQGNIAEAFKRAKEKDLLPHIASRAFLTWLDETDDFLMVRSTGNEDSTLTANAGGNISKAYVRPTRPAFCDAAQEVLLSYFSTDSLQNLINAKINPFAQKPTLAVMAQRLIGETAKEIPISLVLFTNEPLYVGKEKFRCMKISATYGHGEGVVGGVGIGTDSVLLLESETNPQKLIVIYSNGDKPERLAPVRGKLAPVDNPPYLQKRFALNEKLLARLFTLGVVVEKGFNQPTDMEIVIKGETIYPVQARPVNRPELLPTYLNTKITPSSMISLQGETLAPGTASAIVAKPHEICFAPTLKEAERDYNGEKGVVVHTPEPANSHPIVNFSGLGVPCLYLSDFQPLKAHTGSLVLCMQEGTASLWDPSYGRPEDFIAEGFTTHPAPISISLPHDFGYKTKRKNLIVPKEIKELLHLARSSATKSVALKALDELHIHPFVASLQKEIKHPVVDSLVKCIETAFQEAAAALKNSDERLRTLLHLKVIETLLVTGEYSRISVEPYLEDAKDLAAYQAKFPFPVRFSSIYLAGDAAIHPSSKAAWRAFLENLERRRVDPTRLIRAIKTLDSGKLLPLWFAFFFKSDATLETLLASLEETNIQKIVEVGRSIAAAKGNLQKLQELSEKVISLAKQTSPFTSLVLLNTIYETVDLFDLSIKQMKANTKLKPEEKTPLFKKMIGAYFALLKSVLKEVQFASTVSVREPLNDYMKELETIFNELPAEGANQLRPSADFSVAATALGSETRSKGYRPHTLEDFFTLVHQNLLAVLSHCTNQWISETAMANSALPDEVKQGVKTITESKICVRTGIELAEKMVRVKFNTALRSHSAQMNLNYDLSTNQLTLQALFLGENEIQRWDIGSYLVQSLCRLGICALDCPIQIGKDELIVTWKIGDIPSLLNLYQCMINISYEYSTFEWTDNFIPTGVTRKIFENFKVDREKVAEMVADNKRDMAHYILAFLLDKLDNPKSNYNDDVRFWGNLAFRENDRFCFEYFRNYINSVKEYYPEFIPQIARMQIYEDRDVNSLKIMDLYNSILLSDRSQAEPFKEIFISLVKTHINSGNQQLRQAALDLVFLIDAPELRKVAVFKGVNDPHLPVRESAYWRFNTLVKDKLYLKEALAAAKKGLNDTELSIRSASYYLYASLISSGGADDQEGLRLAAQWDRHQNEKEKLGALKLFIPLIEKEEGLEQALAAAQKAEKDFFDTSLEIYQALVRKGVYYEQAKAAALQHGNKAISILNALVDRGEAYDLAVDAAVSLTKNLAGAYFEASKLFKKLYERDVCTEKLLEALVNNLLKHSSSRSYQECGYSIIKETYLTGEKKLLVVDKLAALIKGEDHYNYPYVKELNWLL